MNVCKRRKRVRIYATADIHGRPSRLTLMADIVKAYQPDACVVAGDIVNYVNCEPVLARLNTLDTPVLLVRGNTDPAKMTLLCKRYHNLRSLHLQSRVVNRVRFVGADGTIPIPFRSRICFFQARLMRELSSLIMPGTVLVLHPPPYGVLDEVAGKWHAGCDGVNALIREKKPSLVICGHIHESAGIKSVEGTHIVNCSMGRGGGALIEMDRYDIKSVRMVPV